MLGLFNKTAELSDYSFLGIDFHNHVLPGIDDGARDLDESVELIKNLSSFGFRHIVATPHIFQEYYPNTPDIIEEKRRLVQQRLDDEGIDVFLDAAAEYYVDEYFEDLISRENLLCVYDNRVLLEMSFYSMYPRFHEVVFTLKTKGYVPILAHPERYTFLLDDWTALEQLKDIGCRFQVNLLSLAGTYGSRVQKWAMRIVQKGMADYLCTDIHLAEQLPFLQKALKNHKIARLLSNQAFKNVEITPQKLQ